MSLLLLILLVTGVTKYLTPWEESKASASHSRISSHDKYKLEFNVLSRPNLLVDNIPYGFTPNKGIYGGHLEILEEQEGLLEDFSFYVIKVDGTLIILDNEGHYWIP